MFLFDQPWPTTFYLTLYLVTMVLHVLPMNYVLAGSTYLVGVSFVETLLGRRIDRQLPLVRLLRDWMPFALSIAITAGIAPLLFLQILYKEPFYTANLLLFHRWMAILPVLIGAFYFLYLQKSKRFEKWSPIWQLLISGGIVACFGFVAWSWTENHLLSLRGQEVWTAQYASGSLFYRDSETWPRLAVWYLGAFPTLALLLAWQLNLTATPRPKTTLPALKQFANMSLIACSAVVTNYMYAIPEETLEPILQQGAGFVGLVAVGGVLQIAGWQLVDIRRIGLGIITVGVCCSTLGATLLRELRRLAAIDITSFQETHAAAADKGGLIAFLVFAAINVGVIGYVGYLIRQRVGTATK